MSRRDPKTPGLYWLALDVGGEFKHDTPLLVRVSVVSEYGEARIEFLDYPNRNPETTFNPIIDEPHGPTRGLRAFTHGALVQFERDTVMLHWIGPVRAPKMPVQA